jgi:HSP20 family molecular chaperone IbpA
MLVPRNNSFDLFDDLFEDEFFPRHEVFTRKERNLMRTDIKEKNDKYLLDIDLPGFEKENINISLNNGYLTVEAKVNRNEKKEENEKFVRKERFYGECSRSYYVGDDIKEEDINAEFKNGILKVEIPKKQIENKTKEVKQIPIK